MTSHKNLTGYISVLGVVFLAFGIFANVALYVSFSDNYFYKIVYGGMGFGLDLWKAGALILAFALWGRSAYLLAVVSGLFFVVLTLISIGAGFGFTQQMLSAYEAKARLASDEYAAAKAQLSAAQSQVQGLSQYAGNHSGDDLASLEAERLALLQAKATNMGGAAAGTVAQRVGNCSGSGYYVGKYCPAIKLIDQKIIDAKATQSGAASYAGAVKFETQARLSLASVGKGSTSTSPVHPMFNGLGSLFSINPMQAKYYFFILSILMVEVLGTLSLLMANRLNSASSIKNMTLAEFEAQSIAIAETQARLLGAAGELPVKRLAHS